MRVTNARRCRRLSVVSATLLLLTAFVPPSPKQDPDRDEPVRYGRDVRRILSDRCFQCHGADGAAREADLRLDLRESAVDDTGVIVPGSIEDSELWDRITTDDPDFVMPPPSANRQPLSEAERDVLRRWIEQGAEYEEHWAFVPPHRSEAPPAADPRWDRETIDRFVHAGLRARGLEPSAPADPATLLRRVYLDLTGLPPTAEELDAFLAAAGSEEDRLERAYTDVVDRLFTTEPYRSRLAEHLTVPWLDAARYGDTIGIHTDNGRQHWLWRDWVLRAFRDNMPYDRFVREQLAGDLMPDASREQKIASGFHRNHVITDEGGALNDEYLFEYAVDRTDTTGTVFLGLTMGCARCHDHKFDPISQEDYYGLLGFFNSIDEPGLYSQTPNANRAYEPFLPVPSAEQEAERERLTARRREVLDALEKPVPGETESFAAFRTESRAAVRWAPLQPLRAASSDEAVTLAIGEDGSVVARGPVPDFEDYSLEFRANGDARVLLIEALATPPSDPDSELPAGAGRSDHGNVVLTHIEVAARPAGDSSAEYLPAALLWGWADHSQQNLDYEVGRALQRDNRGWAADGNRSAGPRSLMFLAEEPFGEGPVDLRVRLEFRSRYARHQFAHIRLQAAPLTDTARLPVQLGRWHKVGFFKPTGGSDRERLYTEAFGPESATELDLEARFGPDEVRWTFDGELVDGEVVPLPAEVGVYFVGRELWSPDARSVECAVGSDDGFALYLNGEPVVERRVDRGAAEDQDRVTLDLRPGHNLLVFKVVNTGGQSGYAFRMIEAEGVLIEELPAALLPEGTVHPHQEPDLLESWRREVSAEYRQMTEERDALADRLRSLRDEIPRTMVMRELEEPRPSYVMERGQYDAPDPTRPAGRRTPSALPPLPDDAPKNRLGFAQWLTMPGHPLFARVAVNRFWQHLFGGGLVRTPEDFGLQGEWPTHPELLDTLAVEFEESGYDVHGLLRRIVLSATYRQSSAHSGELAALDPGDRLHGRYPRRRLSAEQIRDHALYTAGLLVETFGGPSVKPYQPEGLWREVAMLASNTRFFTRDDGDALWRRSLYTYWKRAAPPPSLLTFDAPTRESCVVSRPRTNTPLQALVLWNDVQFVEAARRLAARVCEQEGRSPEQRVEWLFQTVTGRAPEDDERNAILRMLDASRERFATAPDDAAQLLAHGEAQRGAPAVPDAELAAWTLVCNALLNLHETITQD